MAALTNSRETDQKEGVLVAHNAKGNKRIFGGSLVNYDDATGLIEPGTDATGKTFCGVAYEPINNLVISGVAGSGDDAAAGGKVWKEGTFVFDFQGARSAPVVGKKCYVYDDHTVALAATTTNDIYAGDIVGLVGDAQVRIRINRAVA